MIKPSNVSDLARTLKTDFKAMQLIANGLISLAIEKDAAYGSAWCKRGGQGAFFQGVARKWDRLETQLSAVGYDMFDLSASEETAESLDESLRDLVNYSLLALEKRAALRAALGDRKLVEAAQAGKSNRRVSHGGPYGEFLDVARPGPDNSGNATSAYVDQSRDTDSSLDHKSVESTKGGLDGPNR